VQIKIAAITAALLAGTAAVAYAQVSMTQTQGNVAPGDSGQLNRLNPNSGSPATGGYGTLGAGDPAVGNWTGTNPGINRKQTGGYPVFGAGYSDGTVAPGGNGSLGAGDINIGSWTGTNPGIDRRSVGGYYSPGGNYYGPPFR
jgi:hypothetical protein